VENIPLSFLFGSLVFLLILSAFFSGSETALMTLNRYRLKHLATREKHSGAIRASKLLERPDRLIGLILLGNNFVNILASSLATIIALRLWGESGIAIAAGILTFVILIFAEVTPKTLAAIHPERLAFPAALIYTPLLKLLYPLVWIVNIIANSLLKLLGVTVDKSSQALSREELRTVVIEASTKLPQKHQSMLLGILDLEKLTIEDIMIPRNELVGFDIDDPLDVILKQISHSQYARLIVYEDNMENVIGFIHVRKAAYMMMNEETSHDALRKIIEQAFYIVEGSSLHTLMNQFQVEKQRIGLVVDEYGDIQGLVTLEDILEEIIGEFTTDPATNNKDIYLQDDGSYMVAGSINVKEINKALGWSLSVDGPKTLNGLILEYLENIPETGTSLLLNGHPIEIVHTTSHSVKMVKIHNQLKNDA
jgi:Mg2+/Co2+ transporter CorB